MAEQTEELIRLSIPFRVPYRWVAGPYVGAFLKELRDNARMIANICPSCGRVRTPPRIFCGRCFVKMEDDFIVLGGKGTIISFTVTGGDIQPMIDPETGENRPVYTAATILLDSCTEPFLHVLDEHDPDKIKIGMRLEAVFRPKEERRGLITDILHFRIISE